ncbi:DUF6480 family protein [Streptomyces sp. NPDC047315]|uniref:DUF6480 family protein n=1 Tax=Streptomyces sp. NPDC047315 TaxID=3155142 RepID=UPI0033D694A9
MNTDRTGGNPSPAPDPRSTSSPERGAGVPPGETPPAESSTGPETGPRQETSRGWAKGPLIVIAVLVAFMAAFFLAYAIFLMNL